MRSMSGERMKVRILGSAPEHAGVRQFVSSYLISDRVAIDAGCLGFYRTPQEQCQIRHVFLTHCHADHIASLPIFLENVHATGCECPVVYGQAHTLESLQKHVFNDVIWPDFIGLGARTWPFVRLQELRPEETIEVEGLRILPVAVHHAVPTFGYLVSEGEATVVFGGDSGPTERVWALARQAPSLRGVFLEASFPNSMRGLAEVSLHLTPEMFAGEVAKMPPATRVIAVHIKAAYRQAVVKELRALGIPGLEIGECETDYFSLGRESSSVDYLPRPA